MQEEEGDCDSEGVDHAEMDSPIINKLSRSRGL